jgi:hypothetical protein
MPKIVYYLDHISHARVYDDDELAQLQQVYDRAREQLGIDTSDPRRETLAILIFRVWDYTGEVDQALNVVLSKFPK